MSKRHGTREEWTELGLLCWEINDKLVKATVLADGFMPDKDYLILDKAIEVVRHFRSEAEELMFRRDKIDDDKIMYPGQQEVMPM